MEFTVNASAFASDSLQANVDEYEARWQVASLGSFVTLSLLFDTWYQHTDLDSYTFEADENLPLWVRVQYRDNYGIIGAWSTPLYIQPMPPAGIGDLYLGSAGTIYRYDYGTTDGGEPIQLLIRTEEFFPAGAAGEGLFTEVYLHVTNLNAVTLHVTPIVDGLARDPIPLILPARTEPAQDVYEISLADAVTENLVEQLLYGLRGTMIAFKVTCANAADGFLRVHAINLRTEVLRETQPGISYAALDELDLDPFNSTQLYLCGAGTILRVDSGQDDEGEAFDALWESLEYAVAGAGGEAIYTAVYIPILRVNSAAFTLRVTPVVDGVAQAATDIACAPTVAPLLEVVEVILAVSQKDVAGVEWGISAMRGTWFTLRYETVGGRPAGELRFLKPVLEYEVVRESKEPANA